MKPRIMYIELKSGPGGHTDRGPARIGRVTFSKTGRTLYYRGKRVQRTTRGVCGNCYDVDTGEEYWISGPKKDGTDRHRCGGGLVEIDDDVRQEYWTTVRNQPENGCTTVSGLD